jgi:hypothetical protein
VGYVYDAQSQLESEERTFTAVIGSANLATGKAKLTYAKWHAPGVMKWDYSYTNFGENTGRVTYAKNLDDGTLDRSYDYDQVGRLTVSHSGREARWHIGTDTWAIDGPYSQHYGYDQFGNRTHREGWGGSYGGGVNDNPTYSNNKQVGLSYDAAANYTEGGMTYDATGQQIASGGGVTPMPTTATGCVARRWRARRQLITYAAGDVTLKLRSLLRSNGRRRLSPA